MSKIAFIFPGQGAQVVGMGKEIINHYEESKKIFQQANELLDFDLEKICFEENDSIHNTAYTQPALLAVSISILEAIKKWNIEPAYVAGLSLGEYTALVANGSLNYEDAIKLVRARGIYMDQAATKNGGGMAAVMTGDESLITEICENIEGLVGIANYNSNKQIVIAGEEKPFKQAIDQLEEKGLRVIPIKVSGAFHSPLMESAANKLKEPLEKISFNDFEIPYISNVTGDIVKRREDIKELLIDQVTSSVKWTQSVKKMIENGVETFVEIGPSKVLGGLIRKIDRSKKVISVSDEDSLKQLIEYLEVENVR